ncbi:MAG: hypothetical protein ACTHQ3_08600 [Motilibacteraceae bacterium]
MTSHLDDVLRAMTVTERSAWRRIGELAPASPTGRVIRAVVAELDALEALEADLLATLEAEGWPR